MTQERNEILTAAQRIVFAKGYERMTIQDILADLKISSGAFYHYFDSKPAVHGMGNTLTRMLLAFDPEHDVQQRLQSIATTHAAYMEAVERLPSAYPPAAMTKKRRRYSSGRA